MILYFGSQFLRDVSSQSWSGRCFDEGGSKWPTFKPHTAFSRWHRPAPPQRLALSCLIQVTMKKPPDQMVKSTQLDYPEPARLERRPRCAQMCAAVSGFAFADEEGRGEADEDRGKRESRRRRGKPLRRGEPRRGPARSQTPAAPAGVRGDGEEPPQSPA